MTDQSALRSVQDSPFARKLSAFLPLSDDDLTVLAELYRRRRSFPVGADLIHQGQNDPSAYVLVSGWAASYKVLPDGTRQIVGIQIPGDMIGLRSVFFRTSDHSVEPITPLQACEMVRSEMLGDIPRSPRLATALLWAALRDEALVVEHLIDLGRRSAGVRMAHFLLELGSRLGMIGMATQEVYDCPLSQYHLADALGLSTVHVNRVLRDLREAGLVTFQRGRVSFGDYDALVHYAGFDISYLDAKHPVLPPYT